MVLSEYGIERNPRLLSAVARQHRIRSRDVLGLLWDRDTVAFFGDPAYRASLKKQPCPWEQTFQGKRGIYTVTVRASRSVTPKRPPIVLFPHRLQAPRVLEGEEYKPVITDNFLLLPATALQAGRTYRIRFRATPLRSHQIPASMLVSPPTTGR